jgi:hypothetical protein
MSAAAAEVDSRGLTWDKRIHAATKTRRLDNTWRQKHRVDAQTVADVERELMPVVRVPLPRTPSELLIWAHGAMCAGRLVHEQLVAVVLTVTGSRIIGGLAHAPHHVPRVHSILVELTGGWQSSPSVNIRRVRH